jgi:hypothetical protein
LIARPIHIVYGKATKDYVGQELEEGRFEEELEARTACSAVENARVSDSKGFAPPPMQSAGLCLPLGEKHYRSLMMGF